MSIISINARSSIRIKGTKVVYFDPFKIAEERHDADFIFVMHEHYDHFSPEDIRKVSKEQTILVAPYSMKQVVCEQVGKMVSCVEYVNAEESGTELNREDILIKWVPAYNINKPFHTREMGWVGYVVTLDGETYFVTGDTDANEDNIDVQCDILLVPCGGKYTFDVKEAAEFTQKIKPKKVIPTHYTDTGVTMNWDEDILFLIDVAFILEVPAEERVKRVQHREEVRFGSRVMSGGDMYEQQKAFREIIGNRSNERVEESANRLHCKKVRLDGTKSIEDSIGRIMCVLEKIGIG